MLGHISTATPRFREHRTLVARLATEQCRAEYPDILIEQLRKKLKPDENAPC